MKFLLFALLVFISTSSFFAQETDILTNYSIPQFTSHKTSINFNRILDIYHLNQYADGSKSTNYNIYFWLNDSFYLQSNKMNLCSTTYFSFNYAHSINKVKSTTNDYHISKASGLGLTFSANIDCKYYVMDTSGLFLTCAPNITSEKSNGISSTYHTSQITGTLKMSSGIGYGRIITVKFLSQARIISKELRLKLTEGQLYAIAEILEKSEHGYYTALFRDSSKVRFYNEIIKITGAPDHIAKLKRILESTLYQIAVQKNGWEIAVRHHLRYYTTMTNYYRENLSTGARKEFHGIDALFSYSYPFSMDIQFEMRSGYARFFYPIQFEENDSFLNFSLKFNHTMYWQTAVEFTYEGIVERKSFWNFERSMSLHSDFFISNMASITMWFNYYYNVNNSYLPPNIIRRSESIHNSISFKYYFL